MQRCSGGGLVAGCWPGRYGGMHCSRPRPLLLLLLLRACVRACVRSARVRPGSRGYI